MTLQPNDVLYLNERLFGAFATLGSSAPIYAGAVQSLMTFLAAMA